MSVFPPSRIPPGSICSNMNIKSWIKYYIEHNNESNIDPCNLMLSAPLRTQPPCFKLSICSHSPDIWLIAGTTSTNNTPGLVKRGKAPLQPSSQPIPQLCSLFISYYFMALKQTMGRNGGLWHLKSRAFSCSHGDSPTLSQSLWVALVTQ